MKGPRRFHFQLTSVAQLLRGVYMRKLAPARVSYRDDFFISYRVYIMTGSFHITLVEGTLHVDKIHVRFKIANITNDTVAIFRTGVKFSPGHNNRGELTPR